MTKIALGFVIGFLTCVWVYELDFREAVGMLWERTHEEIQEGMQENL